MPGADDLLAMPATLGELISQVNKPPRKPQKPRRRPLSSPDLQPAHVVGAVVVVPRAAGRYGTFMLPCDITVGVHGEILIAISTNHNVVLLLEPEPLVHVHDLRIKIKGNRNKQRCVTNTVVQGPI